ncbi:MAG: hypothetical protein DMG30_28700 [Acidobacteria bacterium]|nr:MAG: hypothetical protein DMG30_28700 [Acidobacteriota bacterium]
MSVGVPDVATVAHLNVEQLQLLGKVHFKVVNFDAPQQVPAALGGQVDAAVAAIGTVASYVKDHKAIVLGVFGKSHWAVAPDIPTFKELGFDVTLPGSFGGIVAPRGTPAYIVTTLNEAIKQALAELSFVSFAEMRGSTIDYQGPKAFARELRRAYEENGELIRVLGLTQK